MNFSDYEFIAKKTMVYKDTKTQFICAGLGLTGESGEVAEKIKKVFRDKEGIISIEDREEIIKEMGDVLWYLASLADYLNVSLSEVARKNIKKLADRHKRNKIQRSGDNR